MTAIIHAERTTQPWGVDALGPKSFEFVGAQAEQNSEPITPEQREQLEIETQSLNSWVAFRVAPEFADSIYLGNPLDTDVTGFMHRIIIPELQAQQLNYQNEAVDIAVRQVPEAVAMRKEMQASLNDYNDSVKQAELEVKRQKETGYGNLRLITNLPEYRKSQARLQGSVNRLNTAIPGLELKTKVWGLMDRELGDLLAPGSEAALQERSQTIVLLAQKSAYEQVIISLKSEVSSQDARKNGRALRAKEAQLQAVMSEFAAFQALHFPAEETHESEVAEPAQQEITVPEVKISRAQRILGSFSSRAAAFSGALFR